MVKKRLVATIPVNSDRNVLELNNILDEPKEVGHYSVDSDSRIRYDRTLMRYYVPQKDGEKKLDLNLGYEDSAKAQESETKGNFETILRWIEHDKFQHLSSSKVDFVCTRGSIKLLMCSPYMAPFEDGWRIIASKLKGVIYMVRMDSEEKKEKERKASEEMKRMFSWGYKFEEYMTADTPGGKPDITSKTHEMEEYVLVVKNRIGPYSALIRAETDATNYPPVNGDTSCYVELKTSKIVPHFNTRGFKRKLLNWWAQSISIGIEDNVCGFRDDEGFVRDIKIFKTSEIPRLVQGFWSPNICFSFLQDTLSFLKRRLPDNPRVTYVLEYHPKLRKVQVSEVEMGTTEYERLLPEWYIKKLEKM